MDSYMITINLGKAFDTINQDLLYAIIEIWTAFSPSVECGKTLQELQNDYLYWLRVCGGCLHHGHQPGT